RADAGRLEREIPNSAPRSEKKRLWAAQDRAEDLAREGTRLLAEANASLDAALANAPDHAGARRLLAELHWDRHVEAEAAGDRRGVILHLRQAERWNDGALDARLRGEGTVTLRTRRWTCDCLSRGRAVAPESLNVFGYHPWSGRRLSGEPVESVPALETGPPPRLRVHAHDCPRIEAPNASVWAWRCEEIDRVLIPVSAREGGAPCPPALLDRLFGDSPYRPRGQGLHLGETPIVGRALPRGSWLLVVSAPGCAPSRVPLVVRRLEESTAEVTVFGADDVPAGFLPVAGGPFFSQGDPGNPASGPAAVVDLPDVFIAQFPVTCADYLAFLIDLARTAPAEATARVPRKGQDGPAYWPQVSPGAWAIPDPAWLAGAPDDLRRQASRLDGATADWLRSWPVLGVSWSDASAYARWRSLRDGRLYSLVHEDAWEKAGRGVDARAFPWGETFDPCLCNAYGSHREGYFPVPVRDCPFDESPWGIRGLAGNSWDWCLNDPGLTHPGFRIGKGGSFTQAPPRNRMSHSGVNHLHAAFFTNGIRLAAACALTPPGETWYREDRRKRPAPRA
ncbi:MAG: SUMF1/EgtB/PvdO family nonheme iron enzyme, partial [Candidatus Brocadiae bacterium]|nr:SUMF1/EgtB/PvdO family nonheme iron enzyme [Candidatus Brocadiia bacterium]